MITHNKDKAWCVILIIISIVSLLFAISVYSRKNRYIAEDKDQFIYEINNSITRSKVEIDNIILHKEEIYLDYKDLKLLMIYNNNLNRSIFGFLLKSDFVSSEFADDFRKLWDNYNYNETINAEDIRSYYEQLSKRAESKESIILNDDDVYMLQEILKFYNKTRREINNLL